MIKVGKNVQLEPVSRASLKKNMPDLVQMDFINEGSIAHNLKVRFMADQIYTAVGTILVSINPYKQLPLYTPSKIQVKKKKSYFFIKFFFFYI